MFIHLEFSMVRMLFAVHFTLNSLSASPLLHKGLKVACYLCSMHDIAFDGRVLQNTFFLKFLSVSKYNKTKICARKSPQRR